MIKKPYRSESELIGAMLDKPEWVAAYIHQLENALNIKESHAPTEAIKAPVVETTKVSVPYRTWARVISIAELPIDHVIHVTKDDNIGFAILCDAKKWSIYGEDIKESYANNTFIAIDYDIDKDGYKFLISAVPF